MYRLDQRIHDQVGTHARSQLIAGGYIGGQVPKDTAILELNLDLYMKTRAATIGRYETSFGEDTRKYFDIPEGLLQSAQMKKITILNPMLALNIGEEDIISQLAPLGWKPTLDTGSNSSNCRLNDFGIAMHYNTHGFNPLRVWKFQSKFVTDS